LKTTWANPKIYYWNATPGGATTTWPGVSMASEGHGWFVFTIPNASCANVIFSNNGATQTGDLYRCNEGWYNNGTWYNTLPSGRSENISIDQEENESSSEDLQLSHYPNPTSDNVTLTFSIREAQTVSIKVFNRNGIEISEPVNKYFDAGNHSIEINTSALPAGMYIYKVNAGKNSKAKKILIIK
jgi:hypothetical protein